MFSLIGCLKCSVTAIGVWKRSATLHGTIEAPDLHGIRSIKKSCRHLTCVAGGALAAVNQPVCQTSSVTTQAKPAGSR